VSVDTVVRKFESRAGVLNLGSEESRFKRRYWTLRIPREGEVHPRNTPTVNLETHNQKGEIKMEEKTAEIFRKAADAAQIGRPNYHPSEAESSPVTKSDSTKALPCRKLFVGFGEIKVILGHDENQKPLAYLIDEHDRVLWSSTPWTGWRVRSLSEIAGESGAEALKAVVRHLES
jgi:hypothetical protein